MNADSSISRNESRGRTGSQRGFTLTELMVALTGGLIFSIFVFGLTANVSRFFQEQTRLADTTMSVVAGYQRLRADVQRAGFLASPNFAVDPKRCPAPDKANYANLLSRLPATTRSAYPQLERIALARIEGGVAGPLLGKAVITDAGLDPDYLYLYGNYISADSYPTRGLAAGTAAVVLEPASPELVRAGYVHGSATAQDVLNALFPPGRLLRAFDPSTGEEQYSVTADTNATAALGPTINLVPTMPFAWKGSQPTCGLRGSASGLRVNPVNIIRYGLADLTSTGAFPQYAFLDDALGYDRVEFVREEINPASGDAVLAAGNGQFAGTTELVAEFAADFRVDIVAVTNPATGATQFLDSTDAAFLNYAGDPTDIAQAAGINRGPHLIRTLHPRLSVRERIPSRQADMDASAPPGLFRLALTDTGSTPKDYAKVRTLQSHIMTRNARNVRW